MSAERYEIFDDGALTIAIKLGENTQYVDELEDDFVVGAIRQQARDIKLLTQMLHEQRLVIDDLEHRRVKVCDENDQLRIDLAAAVAKRDEWASGVARLSSQLGNLLAVIHRDGGHYESEHGTEKACADAELAVHAQRGIADGYHDALKIWRQRAEQAEARLAALAELEKAAAEPVAWVIGKPTHGHEIGRYLAWNAGHVPHSVGSAAEPLYAAPPAPVAEIREPTPEECERIDSVYASLDRTSHGRAMFNAVRNVMWPKEGL